MKQFYEKKAFSAIFMSISMGNRLFMYGPFLYIRRLEGVYDSHDRRSAPGDGGRLTESPRCLLLVA